MFDLRLSVPKIEHRLLRFLGLLGSPGDLVTIADIEAEEKLSKAFKQFVIGSEVVGEEVTSKKPDTIHLLSSAPLVWVIDPIDGTKNFTKGNHLFCVMVCLVRFGTPVLAVIFDPLNDRYIAAEEGSGSWLHKTTNSSAEKLKVAEAVKLDQMSGFLSLGGFRDRLDSKIKYIKLEQQILSFLEKFRQ